MQVLSPEASLGLDFHYMYDNVFKMVAVCQNSAKEEVCYPLVAKAGVALMQFEPRPGLWISSGVPSSMASKVCKRPAGQQSGPPTKQTKKEEEKFEKMEDDDDEEEEGVAKDAEPGERKDDTQSIARQRVWGKKKASSEANPLVDNVFMVHAKKGNVRAYAMARCGTCNKFLVEVSSKATPNYLKVMKAMCKDMSSQAAQGVSFLALKAWAKARRPSLL